jgi:hypothetical protein
MPHAAESAAARERIRLVRHGLVLCQLTVAWNIVEGAVGITAGVLAGSVALTGFGIDSLVETASAAAVGWRMAAEMKNTSPASVEAVERRAARLAGSLLLGYGAEPAPSMLGGWS